MFFSQIRTGTMWFLKLHAEIKHYHLRIRPAAHTVKLAGFRGHLKFNTSSQIILFLTSLLVEWNWIWALCACYVSSVQSATNKRRKLLKKNQCSPVWVRFSVFFRTKPFESALQGVETMTIWAIMGFWSAHTCLWMFQGCSLRKTLHLKLYNF